MKSPDAILDRLQQALVHLHRVDDYTQVLPRSNQQALSSAFCSQFDAQQQDLFVHYGAQNYSMMHSFFQEQLNAPLSASITQLFERSAQQVVATPQVPSPMFCRLFLHIAKDSNTFDTSESMVTGLLDAERSGHSLDLFRALDVCTLLAAALPRTQFANSEQRQSYTRRLLPVALAAANPFVTQEPKAAWLSWQWSKQWVSWQSQDLTTQTLTAVAKPSSTDELAQGFSWTYRTVQAHIDGSADAAHPETAAVRAYALFTLLHSFVDDAFGRPSCQSWLKAWRQRHQKRHELLRIAINTQCEALAHPHIRDIEPLRLQQLPARTFDPVKASNQSLAAVEETLLRLPWVQQLKHNLQMALAGKNLPVNRTLCLHGEPGNGKTETIRHILAHFAAASVADDALEAGWQGPLLCVSVDSQELLGTHYNESASKIRDVFEAIRAQAARLGGVAAVFVDEVDRFLMGGDTSSHREDDKNLGELTRLLDNSIANNSLFFLCATNRFEDLAPAAKSRLKMNQVAYETPLALRTAAVDKLLTLMLGLQESSEVKPQTSSPCPPEPDEQPDKTVIWAVLGALCAHLTLRDICALHDCVAPGIIASEDVTLGPGDKLLLVMQKIAAITPHGGGSAPMAQLVKWVRRPGGPREEDCSIQWVAKSQHLQAILQDGHRKTGQWVGHVQTVVTQEFAFSLVLYDKGVHLLCCRASGTGPMRMQIRRFSFWSQDTLEDWQKQKINAQAQSPFYPATIDQDFLNGSLPLENLPCPELGAPSDDTESIYSVGIDLIPQNDDESPKKSGLDNLFAAARFA